MECFITGNVFVGLTADPKDENIVYAASQMGIFVSKDKGETWNRLMEGFVSTIAVNPNDSQELLSYSEKNKFAISNNAGQTWESINETFNEETPLFIAYSKKDPKIIYILTEKNSIYKSSDQGTSWNKIR